jgi:SPP1 family predicted phage head-tail adaptor
MARQLRFCNPGRFNRRITVLEKSTSVDELGQPVETYADAGTWWAEKKDIKAAERFRSDQEIASETTVFEGRWRSDITTQHRLRLDSKDYDVEGLIEIGLRERLQIIATAVRV